jgi:tRNA nucleotidyltransferase (CCA-adding enzyme)
MPRPDIVDDILWGQLHKLTGQLKAHLADFQPKDILVDDSRHLVRLAVILGKDRLPEKMLAAGPPLSMKKHAAQFRKSHKKAKFVIKRKKLYAEVRRPVVKAEDAIHAFFRAFATTRSHLAYPEEMIVLEKAK